ncbi:MAG: hypothetical protein BAJALOKI2v1_50044 [Promethearchaeota archaeon]|nr:MAG: hypothetical protein BAJALOKI2v1_50044 [Candidatus Lokiarchaeota archaeon]
MTKYLIYEQRTIIFIVIPIGMKRKLQGKSTNPKTEALVMTDSFYFLSFKD